LTTSIKIPNNKNHKKTNPSNSKTSKSINNSHSKINSKDKRIANLSLNKINERSI